MSQLRLLKPASVFKNVLRHTTNVRMFSTCPFLLIDHLLNSQGIDDDDHVAKSYGKKLPKKICISDWNLKMEVRNAMAFGFSRNRSLSFKLLDKNGDYVRGWDKNGDHSSLRIQINHEPSELLYAEPVPASLPPLPSGSKIQNIAMSCLPVRDKDWVVGVKFSGSRLSLCRPFGDRKWINIKAMPESISSFSSIMFSKKYQKFYIPSPGGEHLCSLDLHFKEEDQPEFIDMAFDDLPKSVVSELEVLSPCSKTDHLVESPTGELFLVKWYGEDYEGVFDEVGLRSLMHKTKKFMVFRANESGEDDDVYKNMVYTEDIGDLCIFLGHSEAICVPASSSPGLRPNCIYFVGFNFGVYALTTKTCTTFFEKDYKGTELIKEWKFPYWPLPLPVK